MDLNDLGLLFAAGPRKIFEFRAVDYDILFVEYQPVNFVLAGPVKIDRSRMTFLKCPDSVNGSDGLSGLFFKDRVCLSGRTDIDRELRVPL